MASFNSLKVLKSYTAKMTKYMNFVAVESIINSSRVNIFSPKAYRSGRQTK